jgi:hypothetical protein
MSTRSMIAVMHGNVAKAVYCHWDGYVAHNGAILQEHYDSVKANKLVSMGDLSSLRANIGEKHDFSRLDSDLAAEEYEEMYGDMCTFYGRDRGEEGTEYTTFQTLADLLEAAEGRWCEYVYIMREGVWYYSKRTVVENGDEYLNLWTPLEFVSAALEIEEAV